MSELVHLHPLVFTLQDVITGCGFLAGIVVTGKAVMEHEDGKWWMYGVCPGSIAASGDTPNEAFSDFRNRYKETLFDMADDCGNYLSFRKSVHEFFAEDAHENARWESALKILRENQSAVSESFKNVPRIHQGDYTVGIHVDRLENKKPETLKPAANITESFSKVA